MAWFSESISDTDADALLHRIQSLVCVTSEAATNRDDVLRTIVRGWVHSVPFENIDPLLRRTAASLNLSDLLARVVGGHRGGFCFEQNGLLGALLIKLGFEVSLATARMWRPQSSEYGPVNTHMLLIVQTRSGTATKWVVDVANGNWMVEPLHLEDDALQTEGQDGEAYQLVRLRPGDTSADGLVIASDALALETPLWRLYELIPDGAPVVQHAVPNQACGASHSPCPPGYSRRLVFEFDTTPRELIEFQAMSDFHSTSSESSFTQGIIATRRLPGGTGGRVAVVSGPWAGGACGGAASRAWDLADEPTAVLWTRQRAHGPKDEQLLRGWGEIASALQGHLGINVAMPVKQAAAVNF